MKKVQCVLVISLALFFTPRAHCAVYFDYILESILKAWISYCVWAKTLINFKCKIDTNLSDEAIEYYWYMSCPANNALWKKYGLLKNKFNSALMMQSEGFLSSPIAALVVSLYFDIMQSVNANPGLCFSAWWLLACAHIFPFQSFKVAFVG